MPRARRMKTRILSSQRTRFSASSRSTTSPPGSCTRTRCRTARRSTVRRSRARGITCASSTGCTTSIRSTRTSSSIRIRVRRCTASRVERARFWTSLIHANVGSFMWKMAGETDRRRSTTSSRPDRPAACSARRSTGWRPHHQGQRRNGAEPGARFARCCLAAERHQPAHLRQRFRANFPTRSRRSGRSGSARPRGHGEG